MRTAVMGENTGTRMLDISTAYLECFVGVHFKMVIGRIERDLIVCACTIEPP